MLSYSVLDRVRANGFGKMITMQTLQDRLPSITTLTFDCYGTLVDWRAGIIASLGTLFQVGIGAEQDKLYKAYVPLEAEVEAESYRSYREIMTDTARRLASKFEIDLPAERAEQFPDFLPRWPLFADTVAALNRLKLRYRLGILSNVDRDLFDGTAEALGVEFDFVVTAQDVGSYKPALAHFQRMFEQHADRGEVLHVAQSLFHDGAPAHEFDLAYVWINRYNDVNETKVKPLATFTDLKSLADELDL